MPRVLVPLAPGFEEIEAVTVIDVLRRANVEVVVAGLDEGPIEGSRGVKVVPDATLAGAGSEFDMIVLPGGAKGAERLRQDERLASLIRDLVARKKPVAAICAAPIVLSHLGLLEGRKATGHPSVFSLLRAGQVVTDRVVVDGPIVTSRAPGTAMEFAFKLVEILVGRTKAEEVNRGVLAKL
ncbi:MAG TPA: DJ-1 family glyoxalase III [Planctomycetota bacterium]|jgi:4-methyl-5(b-hydroxyethyl)-thiazole monophosphate biosynthesis|nr:DJ-1 family glyoxalase III [Planctomycetota bacterium]